MSDKDHINDRMRRLREGFYVIPTGARPMIARIYTTPTPLVAAIALLAICMTARAQQVTLTPLINSLGIHVSNARSIDSCQFYYRLQNEGVWYKGYQPDRVLIDTAVEYRASLFPLDSSMTVDVRMIIWRGNDSLTLPIVSGRTSTPPTMPMSRTVKYVAPNGSGSVYSRTNPGSLTSLFTSGSIECGTTVILLDGIYRDRELRIVLDRDCPAAEPISLIADSATSPVIDGGVTLGGGWERDPIDTALFKRSLPVEAAHTTVCVLADRLLYPYPSLYPEALLGGYGLTMLSYGNDGFVRDDKTIWIKTSDGRDPGTSTVTVSTAHYFLSVQGNGHDGNLLIKGLTFRHFAKPRLYPLGSDIDALSALVLDIRSTNHIVIDQCRFEHNSTAISLSGDCNTYLIQDCTFEDQVGRWTYAMIKMSSDFIHTPFLTLQTSRGRRVETTAIFLERSSSGVIRNNRFIGLNSGVESFLDKGRNEEIDIYGNELTDCFDAIECDGFWSNLRIWGNRFHGAMAGISAAPPLMGPRYVYRNVFAGMRGRRSEPIDPYFIGCSPSNNSYRMHAVAIKTNSTYAGNGSPGNLHVLNNTMYTDDSLGFALAPWQSEWERGIFINNVYCHESASLFHYFNLGDTAANKDFQITSLHDCYHTFGGSGHLATIQEQYGRFSCIEVSDVAALQETLRAVSHSMDIRIGDATQGDPLFSNRSRYDFTLSPDSPLIDAGMVIPGFMDYHGSAPEIGAHELATSTSKADHDAPGTALIIYPKPLHDVLIVTARDMPNGFTATVYDCTLRVIRTTSTTHDSMHWDLSTLPTGLYTITIANGATHHRRTFLKQ